MTYASRFRINLTLGLAMMVIFAIDPVTFVDAVRDGDFSRGVYSLISGVVALVIAFYTINRSFRRERAASNVGRRFTTLIENSDDLVIFVNPRREIEYMNRAGRNKLGFAADASFQGISSPSLYAPGFNEIVKAQVLPALLDRQTWRGELSYVNAVTGEVIPVHCTILPMHDEETDELVGFATVSQDLRERKKLEKRLDRFFEVSLDMLAIANLQGYFLRLNPAFSQVLGYTEEEMRAHPASYFIHPDDLAATAGQLARQADGHTIRSFENRYRTKAGDYRWFSWTSFPDGELTYGAARDITEQKIQHDLMRSLSEKAISASLAKSEFLANMSHEIRTPINGVIGSTTLLLDTSLNEEQRGLANDVETSANSLLTLINDILDFSKIEAGKLDIELVDFNLENLVSETAQSMAWALRNKSLPLTVAGVEHLNQHFRGDPGRVRQVLTNLLSNAIKFTAQGSIRIDVRVEETAPGQSRVNFAVTDTGIGIAKATQERLFQPFMQADESTTRKFGGTGLGLSISRKLVELMGGEMGVVSHDGRGSTFWFAITLAHSAKVVSAPRPKAAIPATKFEGASILVAEDNIINQKILLSMLRKMGFKAQAVANGLEVLSLLHEVPFDMILMDCQMPEMDGYETTRRIRVSGSLTNPDLPIVAMTANALKGDRERCLESGMNDYATKPIDVNDLAAVVERWLEAAGTMKTAG